MKGRLGLIALALFVALDLVLVTLAMRHTYARPPVGETPVSSPVESSSTGASDTADPTPSGDASAAAPATSPVLLGVADDGTVLRVSRGSCDGGEKPEAAVSTNRGRRISAITVNGLSQALALRVRSESDLTLVGLTPGCALSTWTSVDAGQTWTPETGAAGEWHLSPARRRQSVFSPGGRRDTPCSPRSIGPVDDGVARLLCRDGSVEGTSDGGASWITLGRLRGATAISFDSPGDGVAVAEQDGCGSALMRTTDGGTSWSQVSCVEDAAPRGVAAAGDLVVVQAGDSLRVSADAGQTWKRAARETKS